MSSNEAHRQSKRFTTLCAACRERKARFKYRGEVRADRDHTLCFECYRGEINRARARRLTEPSERLPIERSAGLQACRRGEPEGPHCNDSETALSPPRRPSPFGHQQSACDRVLDERQLAHRQLMLDYLQRQSAVAS